MRKFLTFFFVLMAFLAAIAFWYWRGNIYSKEVLKLEILGPENIQAGQEIDYTVKFKNNGKARLESVELVFEYPSNALPVGETAQRIVKKLEDIYPGEERSTVFKAIAIGKEGDTVQAQASLFYNPKNLKARYESKTNLTTKITSVPLTLEFDLPQKVEQGDDLNFTVNYFSNMDFVLENLRLKVIYPTGFSFVSSQPKGIDIAEWSLPTLTQANGGRVKILGAINGSQGEKKVFRVQLGVVKNESFTLLKETIGTVEISEPSVFISQMINGSQAGAVSVGSLLHYEVYFKNIGASPLQKKFLLVKLNSDFFDLSSLRAENGAIGAGDNSIIFDWQDIQSLRFLDASEEGKVEFWIKTKDPSFSKRIEMPVLRNSVSFSGVEKVFETKIQGNTDFAQKVMRQDDVFAPLGPIPPQIGTSTTYTVFWQIKNYWNGLGNAKVKTILPGNVRLTGQTIPQGASLTFDSVSREVVWSIGDLSAFQGFGDTPFTLAFQIALTPDISQLGQAVPLIGAAYFTAEDKFSGAPIAAQAEAQDTTLPFDDTVNGDNGIVRPQ
ncbi:MAG: hypothetical protein PHE77_03175 [Candidatus Pacebacteria bacterium]|nr:hypothetical protein [Candidatus Paceibacterota bacterium]